MSPRPTHAGARVLLALLVTAIASCATPRAPAPASGSRVGVPALRLPPASLGKTLALHQHLEVRARDERHELESILEVDANELRLALLVLGVPVASLDWDGSELHEQHGKGWPQYVSADRILTDLTLAYWPAATIAAALPAHWELRDADGIRELRSSGRLVASVRGADSESIVLDNWADGYQLHIVSVPLGD